MWERRVPFPLQKAHFKIKSVKLLIFTGEVYARCTLSGKHLWESWLGIPIPRAAHEAVSSGTQQTFSEILQSAQQFVCSLEQPLEKEWKDKIHFVYIVEGTRVLYAYKLYWSAPVLYNGHYIIIMPNTVVMLFKVHRVLDQAKANAGITSSIPVLGMDICVHVTLSACTLPITITTNWNSDMCCALYS
jgi:hypothetical protein